MSHEIDQSNGRPAIAFVGETPWHNLGTEMKPGQTIEQWRKAAGLDYAVHESPVMYQNGELRSWADRKVLFRSDNGAPLSVMSKDFHVVQPSQILDLYGEIARAGGFELEVAGALSGGKRVWALAKVSDGANVVGADRVRPYILLATSFDGSMATTAKFTAVRVVCNNTIQMSMSERDSTTAPGKEQTIKVLHSVKWTDKIAEDVRKDLGIVHNSYERFMVEARNLAGAPMTDTQADEFAAFLLEPYYAKKADGTFKDVRETRGYKRVMELFAQDKAIGSEMAGRTKWGMLNAVTQLVDHERGKSANTRLESAWFGTGNAIKDRARRILTGEFARVA